MNRMLIGGIVVVELAMMSCVAPARLFAAEADTARVEATTQRDGGRIEVMAGRSTVVTSDFDVKRISITNPAVADAVVVHPREILLDGKAPGAVTLIVWGADRRIHYDVAVGADTTALQRQLRALFPDENIRATISDGAVVLAGNVSSGRVMLQAVDVARATVKDATVVNMLQMPGVQRSRQVMLQVRFAEVNRRALTEVGASFFTSPVGSGQWIGRAGTNQFPEAEFQDLSKTETSERTTLEGKLTFSDFLNVFLLNTKYDIGVLIKALKARGLFQSLAEPNLIAFDGQEASFLAGGEIPIPIVQGTGGMAAVTVHYKEFGIRLTFRPTIAGDIIRLRVRPEVSSLDFANGITLEGIRLPALATRRAETEVELADGQSFAIAGLMDNIVQDDVSKVPVLGDLPIIGHLFRSKANRKAQTELMVVVTPRLVYPFNPGEVPALPIDDELFLHPDEFGGRGLGAPLGSRPEVRK